VTVDGIVRLPAGPGWFTPDNDPAGNMWFWADLPAMADHAGLAGEVAPLYLEAGLPGAAAEATGTAEPVYPIGGQTRVRLRNDHLQYAITWYGLAVTLVIIYIAYHRRKPEQEPR
jgi:surfeit locus 1 family protein